MRSSWLGSRLVFGTLIGSLASSLVGCADDDASHLWDEDAEAPDPGDPDAEIPDASVMDDAQVQDDASTDDAGDDAGADAGSDAGDDAGDDAGEPLSLGGLTVNMSHDEQALDLFGEVGHRIWVEVSREQVSLLNEDQFGGGGDDDIYTPGAPEPDPTYADHVLIQDVATQSVADYGKVEVALVGESTFRRWDNLHIPNVRFDADQFEHGKRIGGMEHLRLNNSLVGSIFRERIAHTIYRELGYPALRSSYAFLGSSVWGEDVWVPMTLMEVYKLKFCKDSEDLVGGRCTNMWEFPGDVGAGGGGGFPWPGPGPIVLPVDPFDVPVPRPGDGGGGEGPVPDSWCQIHECDNTRLIELMDTLQATALGAGFQTALDPYIEWDRWHEFQCLSWMMWTGDDPIHNSNNNMIMEREDGKFIWAPYSVDISAGQDWYVNVALTGQGSIALGCQSDPVCWEETIAACEDLITRFDELDPETLVDDAVAVLMEHDMLREGDQERAEQLREWFVWRQGILSDELERFRYLPNVEGACPMDLELCEDGACGTAEQCLTRRCVLGQDFCTTLDRCVDPGNESCPVCEDELTPRYCEWNFTCVASVEACAEACDATDGYEWCALWNSCVMDDECIGLPL